MSEMVERVEQAMRKYVDDTPFPNPLDRGEIREHRLGMARAAITALRIPTDDMIDSGDAAGMTATVRTMTTAIWTAMVKEALR